MFLPINRQDMNLRDWHYLDFLIITGDALVDHYSFGSPLIARWLEHLGYRVGILAQPDWHDLASLQVMGRPRYAVLVSAGNLDSMINHYTASRTHIRRVARLGGGRIMPRRYIVVWPSRLFQIRRLFWAVWRPVCAVLRIMIIGQTALNPPGCWRAVRICWFMAWRN